MGAAITFAAVPLGSGYFAVNVVFVGVFVGGERPASERHEVRAANASEAIQTIMKGWL